MFVHVWLNDMTPQISSGGANTMRLMPKQQAERLLESFLMVMLMQTIH